MYLIFKRPTEVCEEKRFEMIFFIVSMELESNTLEEFKRGLTSTHLASVVHSPGLDLIWNIIHREPLFTGIINIHALSENRVESHRSDFHQFWSRGKNKFSIRSNSCKH